MRACQASDRAAILSGGDGRRGPANRRAMWDSGPSQEAKLAERRPTWSAVAGKRSREGFMIAPAIAPAPGQAQWVAHDCRDAAVHRSELRLGEGCMTASSPFQATRPCLPPRRCTGGLVVAGRLRGSARAKPNGTPLLARRSGELAVLARVPRLHDCASAMLNGALLIAAT